MATKGQATIDFGAAPGSSDTSVVVTGQGGIIAGSKVEAWIRGEATADHSIDEVVVEPIRVTAGNIIVATGFTIYAICDYGLTQGTYLVDWIWD